MQNIKATNLSQTSSILKIVSSSGSQKTVSIPALKTGSIISATVTKVLGNNKVAVQLLDNDVIAETSLEFKQGEKLKLWVKSQENASLIILEVLEKPIKRDTEKLTYTKDNVSAKDSNPDWDEQFAIPVNISGNTFIIKFGNKKPSRQEGTKSEEFYFSTETEKLGTVEVKLYANEVTQASSLRDLTNLNTNRDKPVKKVIVSMHTETPEVSSYIKSNISKLEQAMKEIDWSSSISVEHKRYNINKSIEALA